jgi:hypothetical protein
VWWRRSPAPESTFDQETVGGIIRKLMEIDSKVDRVLELLEDEDGEEEADTDA